MDKADELASSIMSKHFDAFYPDVRADLAAALRSFGDEKIEEAAEIFDGRAEAYALEGEAADIFAVDFANDAAERIRALKSTATVKP